MIRMPQWMKAGFLISTISFGQVYAQVVKVGDLQIDHP